MGYKSKCLLYATIVFSLLFISSCAGLERPSGYIAPYSNEGLPESNILIENNYLSLFFDCSSTMFALTDKKTGAVWYSNPEDWAGDTIAITSARDRLQSQIFLTYGQVTGQTTEISNYSLSVENNSYSWELLGDDSIKVNYTLGRVERIFIIPAALPEPVFMEYHDQMGDAEQNAILNYYRLIDINNLRATDNRDELLELYPALEEERMFVLRENLQRTLMERLEIAFGGIGYSYEDFTRDQVYSGGADESETPVFNISIIYKLDGPDFVVSVPLDEIEYRPQFPVLNVSVLPFFGAGGTEDNGYMVVPDGPGAIMNFNNGKQNQTAFISAMYNYDYGLKRDAILDENFSYFPVFGINKNDHSFICVLEDKAENSTIIADVSGRFNSYNYVYPRYTVINWDDVDISTARIVAKVFERRELYGTISQRYIFTDSVEYADMAVSYRSYLMKEHPWLSKHHEDGLPMALGLLGAVDRTVNLMGLPLVESYALTTYRQAADLIDIYTDAGVGNLRVNMKGWFNGGIAHDAPVNINLISAMGGKKGFEALIETAEKRGAGLFFEADFTFIYNVKAFNGFRVNRDSAKRLSREVVEMTPYSFVYFGPAAYRTGNQGTFNLANPAFTERAIEGFSRKLFNMGGGNITFSCIGRFINSDFNVRSMTPKNEAAAIHQNIMQNLRDEGSQIIIYGGNSYAAVYADFILDMPLRANNYTILDASIPFYQIAIHGLIPYTGTPINLAPDYRSAVLSSIETGAGLQYLFMNASGEELQDTWYTLYYASDINRWGSRPIDLYIELNNDLGHTVNQFITGHKQLAGNVYQTTYEDGTRVLVNYSEEAYTYEGHIIKGYGYLVLKQDGGA